ncbi:FecR family protein [Hufsiella ginkgonis]|uniref:DUF4974 domain-containing protein n=1 Tax=Hufsiella ginkgonis TaxID=2695274 RepID=A0A7K1Y3T1_9SPHI|nr:FecR domain-containing protein [Hufsiella ginkgonis]MXV17346.1 DUF4974 domain-containing protein [Hufsiella ginkgonis]
MNTPEQAYFYANLIVRRLKEGLTGAEEQQLQEWIAGNKANARFLEDLENEAKLREEMEFFSSLDTVKAWNRINAETTGQGPGFVRKFLEKWQYAAAIVVLFLLTGLIFHNYRQAAPNNRITANAPKFKNDLPPGKSRATLILDDGSAVLLGTPGKSLAVLGGSSKKFQKPSSFITVSTPRGGEYKVLLPDGSKVWLNSSSSLTYPAVFAAKERMVKLTGEAYFEVARNKVVPFKVMAGDVAVKVLGTHFNIKAYREEHKISTTLLEGSVEVSKGNSTKMLSPGEELQILDDFDEIEGGDQLAEPPMILKGGNTESAVAWKNGQFLFNNDDIQTVMMQVARWYDAEIEYESKNAALHFTGKISRYTNVSKVLDLLELTGGVHFKIEGKRVIVTK